MAAAVIWFRRDLRLTDHPALHAALEAGDEVVPLFVLDPALLAPAGDARKAFLFGCLRDLHEQTGGALVVRAGDPAVVVPRVAEEVGAAEVHVTADFGPYGGRRDELVDRALGGGLVRVDSPYAVAPGEIRTAAGGAYRVFTPFERAWRRHGWDRPLPAPRKPRWAAVGGGDIPDAPEVTILRPGERAALRRMHRLEEVLRGYRDQRDVPADRNGTSRLSAYLKYGCIHPRQVLAALGRGADADRFRTELAWRDFYAHVLAEWPETARRSFRPEMSTMQVDDDDERFEAWATGTTGFPIVDAGMRQLLGESWMHNRVRMIVASFLVKDLHLDWTRGARHFMRHLQDGDLASNHHGWQWAAGTGTDPSPYVRVFNPTVQGKRFDPDGEYVRRWVPELRGVDAAHVHEPWTLDGGPPEGYPTPIVDHATERLEALRRFAEVGRAGARL